MLVTETPRPEWAAVVIRSIGTETQLAAICGAAGLKGRVFFATF